MPIGLLVPVVLVGWGTTCALASWRWPGAVTRLPALVTNELPFLAGYLLIASCALALAQGDVHSAGGAIVAAAALVVFIGLVVIVRRSLGADAALGNPMPAHRPWRRILLAPLPASRRDVARIRNLSYGDGLRRKLDVYHRRDRPTGVPVVLHFHGGGFHSGNKNREARPLIGYLVSRGMVCASANYRLQPHVGYGEQLADARAAVEWVRSHAQEYGGDPERIFLVGSSAGAYLSIDAVNAGTEGIAGIVGRYGYYGDLVPERPQPPILVIHGEHDLFVRPAYAREFVERMQAGSSHSAEYVQLPGGHHDFDLYESIRSNAVSIAIDRFITTSLSARPNRARSGALARSVGR